MNEVNRSFIKIAAISDMVQAQVLESVLNEREIPYRIRSFHDTAYNGLFQFQKGWGEVFAPVEYQQEIMEIIASLELPEEGE
jgi:hypothetical protein